MAIVAATLFTPAIASAATAYVSASVNVRSGPGANYGRLATLPAGIAVNAGSCRNGWCQIYNGNSVGFVSARYVRFGSYNSTYAAPPNTTVIVSNDGYDNGWGPGFGLGLGLGWASGGGYWGPGWGGPGWRGGPNYVNGCIGRNCQSNRGGGRNGWNPRWGTVRNGVVEDGQTEDVETGRLAWAWDHISHLVQVTSADLTALHSAAVVSVAISAAEACILETCGLCTPDVRNIT